MKDEKKTNRYLHIKRDIKEMFNKGIKQMNRICSNLGVEFLAAIHIKTIWNYAYYTLDHRYINVRTYEQHSRFTIYK